MAYKHAIHTFTPLCVGSPPLVHFHNFRLQLPETFCKSNIRHLLCLSCCTACNSHVHICMVTSASVPEPHTAAVPAAMCGRSSSMHCANSLIGQICLQPCCHRGSKSECESRNNNAHQTCDMQQSLGAVRRVLECPGS